MAIRDWYWPTNRGVGTSPVVVSGRSGHSGRGVGSFLKKNGSVCWQRATVKSEIEEDGGGRNCGGQAQRRAFLSNPTASCAVRSCSGRAGLYAVAAAGGVARPLARVVHESAHHPSRSRQSGGMDLDGSWTSHCARKRRACVLHRRASRQAVPTISPPRMRILDCGTGPFVRGLLCSAYAPCPS